MSLPIPNLDDKPFLQIAEEARALIPGTAPEWTDHNVHDPGITFLELFAWLAEIEHYRLNRTSAASFARFLALAGVTPLGQQAAQVAIVFDSEKLKQGLLVPANTRISAIGNENVPFQTMRDMYLTTAKLKRTVTQAGEREIMQTKAALNEVGHYEAFGPSPAPGDYLRLEFEGWFKEEQGHLAITLFEGDLPPSVPLAEDAQGFVPSARVRWEYLTGPDKAKLSDWTELSVIEDGTLNFHRSGTLIFRRPDVPPALVPTNVDGEEANLHWMRARIVEGRYEIPPRIFSITTNTIRVRQVETIVNEDLGAGLGTPDQVVRLRKAPLFPESRVGDGPFHVGEVLDWSALVMALAKPDEMYEPEQAKAVEYVRESLGKDASEIIKSGGPLDDDKKHRLARAFDRLLDMPDFYRRKRFPGIRIPEEFLELKGGKALACQGKRLRRFNRFILQRALADHIVSDRLEIQTGTASAQTQGKSEGASIWERVGDFSQCETVAQSGGESMSWSSWERVEDFSLSGPHDRHYMLDAETAIVMFGNGLNGRVPQPSESIRARFYMHSLDEEGNLPVGHRWVLAILLPDGRRVELRGENWDAAAGGKKPETLEDAKSRARRVFRKQSPVLTASDYEKLALNTPGLRVARAKVVANFNPKLPCLSLPGEVTVVVVPQPAPRTAFPRLQPPEPTDGFRSTVLNHLDTRRLVTTNVHVIGPRYVKVAVRGRVFLKKGASEKDTAESIRKRLDEFLDPIQGGPERNQGWPFGRPVFPSEIHQQLAKVAGVDYITGVSLNEGKAGEPLPLPFNGLPTPGEHRVEIVSFEGRRQGADSGKGSGCRD